jgi:hypothetical protein
VDLGVQVKKTWLGELEKEPDGKTPPGRERTLVDDDGATVELG